MDKTVEVMIVKPRACNDVEFKVLDLSSFSSLKMIEVGNLSFTYVNEVRMVGLNKLLSVTIGWKCFRQIEGCSPNGSFYLKNCERLRELKIDCGSFEHYSVCEIESVPSLEVLDVGIMEKWSANFFYASLELKSSCYEVE